MSLASWFRLPKFPFASNLKRSTQRQPLRVRPRVEQLEDRMLLTAGSANQQGLLNNATINFNTQAIGLTLPNNNQGQTPLAVTQIVNGMQSPLLSGAAIGAQANLLAQGQVNDQFRAFGVNSMGQSGLGNNIFGLPIQYSMAAMGFGSGVMPNAPWMPAAYNLGLANHQFNYSAQSDMGFQSTPPWFHRFTQPVQYRQGADGDEQTRIPELMLTDQSTKDQGEFPWEAQDEKRWYQNEEKTAPAEKQPAAEDASPELRRGDAAIEEALFTDPLHTIWANRLSQASSSQAREHRLLNGNANTQDAATSEGDSMPSSLMLSAITPAQMAALIAGLPGAAMPASESSEMSAGTAAAE